MGKKQRIRPIALCLLRRGEQILVHEGYDPVKQQAFARPLGGGIEFSETSREAVIREIKEELGADLTDVKLLGIVESIYQYQGEPGHELVFIYDGQFVDDALYQQESLDVVEGERQFQAVWRSPAELSEAGVLLVPEAMAEWL